MQDHVLIAGANGRFGRAAAHAFGEAGWDVSLFARSEPKVMSGNMRWIRGDALDEDAIRSAAKGASLVVNAVSLPLARWSTDLPALTASILQAAYQAAATVIVPGNVYNFGQEMPELLHEDVPQLARGTLGRARVQMEKEYKAAAAKGLQTIILRAGDFIEQGQTGNWFDAQITAQIASGRVKYPGPLDAMHSWAYLPDLAHATRLLAEKRSELEHFETVGFPGFSLTGQYLIEALERICGRDLKVGTVPWNLLKLVSLFKPDFKGILEMSYLWHVPHRIDGGRFTSLLPHFRPTQIDDALRAALADRLR
ncbi:NAD(P)H-binding protein [Parasphingorhabdus litoris]|uniref:NAD(P)H-binding protein n=1 Tax=Parasphingorhabdus litoris TaxID=394733 RepID=A0ABN1A1L4_9SPHN|nr:NAD(P)H-binding protein [Parasphingorhabdus litoris]